MALRCAASTWASTNLDSEDGGDAHPAELFRREGENGLAATRDLDGLPSHAAQQHRGAAVHGVSTGRGGGLIIPQRGRADTQ